jgi:hypothetical protein
MTHEITGCKDCPFEYERQGCHNPILVWGEDTYYDFREYMDAMDGFRDFPSWCPLVWEPTIVKLKNKDL